jgi:hypothetical protein
MPLCPGSILIPDSEGSMPGRGVIVLQRRQPRKLSKRLTLRSCVVFTGDLGEFNPQSCPDHGARASLGCKSASRSRSPVRGSVMLFAVASAPTSSKTVSG